MRRTLSPAAGGTGAGRVTKQEQAILHVGAHRTATTTFQRYLDANRPAFRDAGIEVHYPPATRETPELLHAPPPGPWIISDENILGTMEGNIVAGDIYPGALGQLSRYPALLERATDIYLSIRNYADFWSSAIAFTFDPGVGVPGRDALRAFAEARRGWVEVVEDLRAAAPAARIRVREFGWRPDNPKGQLRQIAQGDYIDATRSERKTHNRRPASDALLLALYRAGDFANAAAIAASEAYMPFDAETREALDARYRRDLKTLREDRRIRKVGTLAYPQVPDAPPAANRAIPRATCVLHIGKTGTTNLMNRIRDAQTADRRRPILCTHRDTAVSTLKAHGRDRRLGFLFRHPEERFVSGFLARRRQGRPYYNSIWSEGEAVAFQYFAEPSDLAEALESADDRMLSAARFAMSQIQHLKLDLRHFLVSPEALRFEEDRGAIAFCCETGALDASLDAIGEAIGLRLGATSDAQRNARPDGQAAALSAAGRRALERVWAAEYEMYEACRGVAARLGFSSA